MNNLMRKVLARRSVYNFSASLMTDEDLMLILEEGRLLSNADNNQAWHFTAVQNKDVIRHVYDLTQEMVANGTTGGPCLRNLKTSSSLLLNMPMILVISGYEGKYAEDAADTLFGSMMLAAEKNHISACWLSNISEQFAESALELKNMLSIPDDYMPLCIGAFGYKSDDDRTRLTKVSNTINIIR